MRSRRTIMCLLLSVLPAAAQLMARTEPPMRPQVMESYGKLPLSFEANQGQTDQRVKFLARGPGYSLFLTQDSAALSLRGRKANAALRMKLLGANVHAAVAGTDGLPGKSNYFVGNDPNQWHTNVPTYAAVKYAGVYPGIDLVYHGDQRLLEYDFVLAPGADPRAIDLRFQGARKLSVNDEGHLVISVGGSEVIEHAPVVYQEIEGQRQTVAGRYVPHGRDRVGFSVAEYDRSKPLVIDPTLAYSTYMGNYTGSGIAVDASGNAYVTGSTNSSDFPTTPGAFQTIYNGAGDAFVSKLNATGSALIYSTYLGGSGTGYGYGIAIDTSGHAYVTGLTYASDFPTTPGAFQTSLLGGRFSSNAFITKLNAAGSSLLYSTYLGGGSDSGIGIAVDISGNAYVTGQTYSPNFPTTVGAFQTTFGGSRSYYISVSDAFVTKLNPAGSALVYSTYLGGIDQDLGNGIAVDASGNAYVTGFAGSANFPITPGAFQTSSSGGAFVTKLNVTGSGLVYSTYLGDGYDSACAIAVDALGNAYITGYAYVGFPTTPGAFQTTFGGAGTAYGDAFVSKLNATGSGLVYSTYLGGSDSDHGLGIAVDTSGNAYVTGGTSSTNYPTTPGAVQTVGVGAFVTELDADGSVLLYSTYLGENAYDYGSGIAVDASGNAYITGSTNSSNFPTTPGAFQTTFSGYNAFVSKLGLGTSLPAPVTIANLNGPSANNGWYLGAVTVSLSATDPNSPVSASYYSVDSGLYQAYGAPFSVAGDGAHQLLFYSVDAANRQETPHGETIQIDSTKPLSHVAGLAVTATSPNFNVSWSGTDTGSGLRDYTIFVSDNSGPFTPWLKQIIGTQAWFAGYLGHTYGFYSIAQDYAGNQENPKTAAEATTYVPQMPGDVNGDGKIDCTDIALVKASFGKRTGQPGFNPAADVNHDGVVNVLDLAVVAQKLIPGTQCP